MNYYRTNGYTNSRNECQFLGVNRYEEYGRGISVCKFCKKAKVKGLELFKMNLNVKKVEVFLNNDKVEATILNGSVFFKKKLKRKSKAVVYRQYLGFLTKVKVITVPNHYYLRVRVTYEDII